MHQQSDGDSLTPVTDLDEWRRKRRIREQVPEEKERSQNLLCSLIEHTGGDSMWMQDGSRHARARNGDHAYNVIWQPRYLLMEQFGKGAIGERDLSRYVVSEMSFVQRMKRIAGEVPDEGEVRGEAVELHEAVQVLLTRIVQAVEDGTLDAREATDLVELCERAEAVVREFKQDAMSARQSGTLPGAVEA